MAKTKVMHSDDDNDDETTAKLVDAGKTRITSPIRKIFVHYYDYLLSSIIVSDIRLLII